MCREENCSAIPKSRSMYCNTVCSSRYHQKRRVLTKDAKEIRRLKDIERRKTPEGKYVVHKKNATSLGITFNLTFKQWWSLWEEHWEGRKPSGLVMCRTNDTGPYAIGNVRIDTHENNVREAHKVRNKRT